MGAVVDLLILFDWICDDRIVNCNLFALTSAVLIWILLAILVIVLVVNLIIVQLLPLNPDKKH